VRRLKKTRLLARDNAIDLWAMDEVRFQQHGFPYHRGSKKVQISRLRRS
jgi:hypothetical protein